jgi:hypothetical protein
MRKFVIAASLIASLVACQKNAENQSGEAANNANTTNEKITAKETTVSSADNANVPKAAIKFETTTYDFGEVPEGQKVKYVYKFVNEGKNPLIIESAQPSCGCTVPTFPKEPIAPGGTGEIVAEFDSNGRPGEQNKTIKVKANTEPAETQLVLKGRVKGKNPEVQDMSQIKGPLKQ